MKLWLLIVMSGHIGGAAGPLPYNMAECRSRAAEMSQGLETKNAEAKRAGLRDATAELYFICVSRERRPELGEEFP